MWHGGTRPCQGGDMWPRRTCPWMVTCGMEGTCPCQDGDVAWGDTSMDGGMWHGRTCPCQDGDMWHGGTCPGCEVACDRGGHIPTSPTTPPRPPPSHHNAVPSVPSFIHRSSLGWDIHHTGCPLCPRVPQATSGSGSSSSQSPSSVRRMSSGLRRGGRPASSLMAKRATVNAATTFSSAMAKLCPMQFLPPCAPLSPPAGGHAGDSRPPSPPPPSGWWSRWWNLPKTWGWRCPRDTQTSGLGDNRHTLNPSRLGV